MHLEEYYTERFVESADPKQEIPMTLDSAISALRIEPEIDDSKIFHLFPRLPLEIRLCIWKHTIMALPARIIPVSEVFKNASIRNKDKIYSYISTRPYQSLSTVSREARMAVFENSISLFELGTRNTSMAICPEKDILLWDGRSHQIGGLKRFAEAIGPEKCRNIRKLAVEYPIRNYTDPVVSRLLGNNAFLLRKLFPSIEVLSCVPLEKKKRFGLEAAKYHVGELELVTSDEAELQDGWRKIGEVQGLRVERRKLGIVGGEKKPGWDYKKKRHMWRLTTEEETGKAKARRAARSERLRRVGMNEDS